MFKLAQRFTLLGQGILRVGKAEWQLLTGAAELPAASYREELNQLCSRFILPIAVMGIFVWLPYLEVDGQLHPEVAF